MLKIGVLDYSYIDTMERKKSNAVRPKSNSI